MLTTYIQILAELLLRFLTHVDQIVELILPQVFQLQRQVLPIERVRSAVVLKDNSTVDGGAHASSRS